MERSNFYFFKVENPDNVDFARIGRENPGKDVILVTFDVLKPRGVLLLSVEFINSFKHKDNIQVAGMSLGSMWGGSMWATDDMKKVKNIAKDGGVHATFVQLNHMTDIIRELQVAQNFRKGKTKMGKKKNEKIKVKVHPIDLEPVKEK
jgi:hypothetical protein